MSHAGRRSRKAVTRAILSALGIALLGGCATAGYYAQSIGGHLDLMAKRQDVDTLVKSPTTPPELKEKLSRAEAIRTFATQELALPDNGSYRTYVDVGKPFVTWNVVATPALSLTAKTWCFPIAGCVSYRGYFDEADARAYGDELAAENMDVAVVGVRAYSTLGWFDDPVLNTFFRKNDASLAGLSFHELAPI